MTRLKYIKMWFNFRDAVNVNTIQSKGALDSIGIDVIMTCLSELN